MGQRIYTRVPFMRIRVVLRMFLMVYFLGERIYKAGRIGNR